MTPSPALCLAAMVMLGGCAQATAQPSPATETWEPAPTTQVSTIPAITEPATTPMVAVRIDPPEAPVVTADGRDDLYATEPCHEWASEALDAGWAPELIPKLLRTIWRESRCHAWIRSTTSDSGLCQINDIVLRDWRFRRDWPNFDPNSLFDGPTNLRVARWLWGIDGWTPWRGGA